MVALAKASERVALETKNKGRISASNGRFKNDSRRNGIQANHRTQDQYKGSFAQQLSEEDMDRKIHELMQDLECANRKYEVYHANVLAVLKDIEEHKQLLYMKLQIVKLSMRNGP